MFSLLSLYFAYRRDVLAAERQVADRVGTPAKPVAAPALEPLPLAA